MYSSTLPAATEEKVEALWGRNVSCDIRSHPGLTYFSLTPHILPVHTGSEQTGGKRRKGLWLSSRAQNEGAGLICKNVLVSQKFRLPQAASRPFHTLILSLPSREHFYESPDL